MSAEDEEAYGVLNKFFDGFFPARWVTREGDEVLDEDGYLMFEAHPINTKALVEFQSYGKAVDLLGFLLCSIDILLYLFSLMCVANPSKLPLHVTWRSIARGC